MDCEKFGSELMYHIEDKANELRRFDNGFALFNIGEFDKLSALIDEITNIVANAIRREG